MPTQNGSGTARSLITRVSNVENDDASDILGDDNTEDSMSMSVSSLNEMSAAVSVVADTDGEESTITLVGDVEGKVVFLTVSSRKTECTHYSNFDA
jgi:ribose-phosphate pyrophosphokinase